MRPIIFAIFLLTPFSLYAKHKGLYGADDRQEVSAEMRDLADATAMMVHAHSLTQDGDRVLIGGQKYQEKYNLCPGERFAQQRTPGDCSGFLVAPDVLVTAAHCVASPGSCENGRWVFGYYADADGESPTQLPSQNVYSCKRIVEAQIDFFIDRHDHAVIKLDRPVRGVSPFKVNKRGDVDDDARLLVIGNPRGLPTKVSGDGHVVDNSNSHWFATNLDTFNGSSGAVVINADSGLVEGLLVRGNEDFARDAFRGCYYTKKYPMFSVDENRQWEHVTRIGNIQYLKTLTP